MATYNPAAAWPGTPPPAGAQLKSTGKQASAQRISELLAQADQPRPGYAPARRTTPSVYGLAAQAPLGDAKAREEARALMAAWQQAGMPGREKLDRSDPEAYQRAMRSRRWKPFYEGKLPGFLQNQPLMQLMPAKSMQERLGMLQEMRQAEEPTPEGQTARQSVFRKLLAASQGPGKAQWATALSPTGLDPAAAIQMLLSQTGRAQPF